MAGYRILSLFQAIAVIFMAISILDFTDVIGLNVAFGFALTGWWTVYAFWGYLIALVGLLQLVKAFIVRERD